MHSLRRILVLSVGLLGAAAVLACAPRAAWAEEDPPLIGAEAMVAHGVAQSGGGGAAKWRESTYVIGLLVDVAINDDPWVSFWGSLQFEGFDRAAVGGFVGLRMRPSRSRTRMAVGVGGMFVPYSALGVSAAVGRCRKSFPRVCLDVQTIFYFTGSDVPEGRVASQFLLSLGIAFDVI